MLIEHEIVEPYLVYVEERLLYKPNLQHQFQQQELAQLATMSLQVFQEFVFKIGTMEAEVFATRAYGG